MENKSVEQMKNKSVEQMENKSVEQMKNKSVKHIKLRLTFKGNGVVNYDDNNQKYLLYNEGLKHLYSRYNNVSYAKKNIYKTSDESYNYKLKISDNAIKHNVFIDQFRFQSSEVMKNSPLLYKAIANKTSLLRGYLYATKKETLKRSSCLTLTPAEQICNAISKLDCFTKSGKKKVIKEGGDKIENNGEQNDGDTSLFFKETVGDIRYQSIGFIDLMQLQFISADDIYDRCSFNSDMFEEYYKPFLKRDLPSFDSDLNYYVIKGDVNKLGEYGLMLNDEAIKDLVKFQLNSILKTEINKSNAYAKVDKLEIKLVYDNFEDSFESDENWITIKSPSELDLIDNLDIEKYYDLMDKNEAEEQRIKLLNG